MMRRKRARAAEHRDLDRLAERDLRLAAAARIVVHTPFLHEVADVHRRIKQFAREQMMYWGRRSSHYTMSDGTVVTVCRGDRGNAYAVNGEECDAQAVARFPLPRAFRRHEIAPY